MELHSWWSTLATYGRAH